MTLSAVCHGQLFEEDFNVDPSASWTVNDPGLSDVTADFFYDYSAIGVPAAPNGSGTIGLKMTANNSGGVFSGFSVSPTGESFTGDYRVSFDLWQNYVGPLGPGGSGSTQLSMFGIGTAGNVAVWPGSAPKESVMFGVTLDGGSAIDFRAYSSVAPAAYPNGDPVYLAPGGETNGSDPYYAGFGGAGAPAAQILGFPGQTGVTDAGEPAFAWRRVVIEVVDDEAAWSIDGLPIARVDLATVTLGGGNLLFGHSDVNSSSSTDPNDTSLNVTLIDNVLVEALGPSCNEDFDALTPPAFPADWTASSCWETFDPDPNPIPPSEPNVARCGSETATNVNHVLTSPVYAATGAGTFELSFQQAYGSTAPNRVGIFEVSKNGGAFVSDFTFADDTQNPWATHTYSDATAVAGDTYQFRWRVTSGAGNGLIRWAIDSLVFEECSTCAIACPADILTGNDPGVCGANVDFAAGVSATPGCGGFTCDPASASFFPVGSTAVTCSSILGGQQCGFDIDVADVELPVVVAPDSSVDNDPGLCSAVVAFTPSAADNCPGLSAVTCAPPSGSVFPVGATPGLCSATDAAGNVGSDPFTVTVVDAEAPVFAQCPDDLFVDVPPGTLSWVVDFVEPTASDNCPGVTSSCVPPSGSVFPIGTTADVCTALDQAGNDAVCTFDVSVGALAIQEIPTTSTWGLVLLALALAAAAALALRRAG